MQYEFWEQIANDIEVQYGNGHPETWNEGQIRTFLYELGYEVIKKCKM